jgi:CDP-diacylglycerol--serine O-phosphatidyltransferase
MIEFDETRRPIDPRHYRRGIFLLPSIITVGNMFCGYACIVFAMRNDLVTAAPFIGFAVVLDMLDGRIARLTKTTSAFGLEFDSLADVISFGVAPAILAFAWGLSELGRVGWAAGFLFVTAAAMRLARFNIQTHTLADKRYFLGMPSPAAAGVTAATVYAWPYPLVGSQAIAAVAVVIVPAVLMVSTIRFRSFKSINFGWTPSYINIILVAAIIALVATWPRVTLVLLAYGYLLSAFVEMAVTRVKAPVEAPLSGEASPSPSSPDRGRS